MKQERINQINECLTRLQNVYDNLESVKEDEECAYDNLPEAMQDGERGEDMQDNIDNLEDALLSIDEAVMVLEEVSSAAENTDILETEPWDNIVPGTFVTHKSFGKGVVIETDCKYITVEFTNKTSKFIAEDAFSKGFLSL